MKISVITVALNNKQTIEDTILSIISQDYYDIEYIIIDGGSTDGTLSTIKKYKNHISVLISEKDNGIYDAMNKGLSIAKGEVIGFLNSDDIYIYPQVLSEVISTFAKQNVDAVFGDLVYVSPQNINRIIRYYDSSKFEPKMLLKGHMPAHPSLFFRKSIYEKFGFFKTDYDIAADFEFAVRVFSKGHINYYYLSKCLVKMRTGGASTKTLKSNFVLNKEIIRACRENGLNTNYLKVYSKYITKIIGLVTKSQHRN